MSFKISIINTTKYPTISAANDPSTNNPTISTLNVPTNLQVLIVMVYFLMILKTLNIIKLFARKIH